MRREDVIQVTKIDREAFPSQLPPPNYQRELRNQLAHYLVACDEDELIEKPEVKTQSEKDSNGLTSVWRRLFNPNHSFSNELSPSNRHNIIGFAGFWVTGDEAHITSIAVKDTHHRQGIGELLLISVISLATGLNARIITLEVRTSNTTAQRLYIKHSFLKIGVHRDYYIDNREDAIQMSTQDITSAAFQTRLQRLKQVHSRKHGIISSTKLFSNYQFSGNYPIHPSNR
ncbi:ribosomal protein S18-alanine N-acetyltransferase [Chloroflexota bacterium]